jgi:hypothetical protein
MLPSEHLHWLYAAAFLMLGLLLLAHAIVGDEIWNHRTSRRYSWPGLGFAMGVLLWPAVVLPMRSTIDLLAHWAWAETTMLAGAAHLALAQGKLRSRYWRLTMPLALGASGFAFLAHERRGWLSGRSPFVHHLCAWTLIAGAVLAVALIVHPRSALLRTAVALVFVVVAVELFSTRDHGPVLALGSLS